MSKLAALLALTALSGTARSAVLGINYNQFLVQIDAGDLKRTKATWVRGFVDYHLFRAGRFKLNSDPGLAKLSSLRKSGTQVILNIKFDFEGRDIPTGARAIAIELRYLDRLLPRVYPLADILVAGNEPFIESKPAQRDARLVSFYVAAAKKIKAFRDRQSRPIPIYIGAFNNLWKPSWQSPAASALLKFAHDMPWIAGIDLHIHHTELSDIDGAFEFTSPRIRDDQKIICTEFSLKNLWKLHNTDPIPSVLVARYRRPADWKIYQYLNFTLGQPVSRAEWVAFLSGCPWFESNKDYPTIAWRKFTGYPKFAIATYGLYQNGPKTFGPHTDPWILNPLLVNETVVRNPKTGQFQANYRFLEEFRGLQP